MSWSAIRYRKVLFRGEQQLSRSESNARRKFLRLCDRKTLEFRFPRPEELSLIFGEPSIERAIRICMRLRALKLRTAERGAPKEFPHFRRRRFRGRNYHHLTPRTRRTERYHNAHPHQNLLLIRIDKHVTWHRVFGVMTLEEVISFLVQLRRMHDASDWQVLCGVKVVVPMRVDRSPISFFNN
jgi:hypothetical protein